MQQTREETNLGSSNALMVIILTSDFAVELSWRVEAAVCGNRRAKRCIQLDKQDRAIAMMVSFATATQDLSSRAVAVADAWCMHPQSHGSFAPLPTLMNDPPLPIRNTARLPRHQRRLCTMISQAALEISNGGIAFWMCVVLPRSGHFGLGWEIAANATPARARVYYPQKDAIRGSVHLCGDATEPPFG
jgi:hypothetical protein